MLWLPILWAQSHPPSSFFLSFHFLAWFGNLGTRPPSLTLISMLFNSLLVQFVCLYWGGLVWHGHLDTRPHCFSMLFNCPLVCLFSSPLPRSFCWFNWRTAVSQSMSCGFTHHQHTFANSFAKSFAKSFANRQTNKYFCTSSTNDSPAQHTFESSFAKTQRDNYFLHKWHKWFTSTYLCMSCVNIFSVKVHNIDVK